MDELSPAGFAVLGGFALCSLTLLVFETRRFAADACGISALPLKARDLTLLVFLLTLSFCASVEIAHFLVPLAKENDGMVFLCAIPQQIIFLLAAVAFVKFSDADVKFSESYASKTKALWLGFFYLLFIPLIFFAAHAWKLGLEFFLGSEIPLQSSVDMFLGLEEPWQFGVAVLCVVILAPLYEELIFRGLLYRIFKSKLGAVFGALLVGVIFSLVHFSLYASLPLLLFSLLLCFVYERGGSIVAPIVLHMLFNAINAAYIIFYATNEML